MGLNVLWISLFSIWIVLVLLGKGGFVHLLFLNGVSVLMIDLVAKYRSRNGRSAAKENGVSQ